MISRPPVDMPDCSRAPRPRPRPPRRPRRRRRRRRRPRRRRRLAPLWPPGEPPEASRGPPNRGLRGPPPGTRLPGTPVGLPPRASGPRWSARPAGLCALAPPPWRRAAAPTSSGPSGASGGILRRPPPADLWGHPASRLRAALSREARRSSRPRADPPWRRAALRHRPRSSFIFAALRVTRAGRIPRCRWEVGPLGGRTDSILSGSGRRI